MSRAVKKFKKAFLPMAVIGMLIISFLLFLILVKQRGPQKVEEKAALIHKKVAKKMMPHKKTAALEKKYKALETRLTTTERRLKRFEKTTKKDINKLAKATGEDFSKVESRVSKLENQEKREDRRRAAVDIKIKKEVSNQVDVVKTKLQEQRERVHKKKLFDRFLDQLAKE